MPGDALVVTNSEVLVASHEQRPEMSKKNPSMYRMGLTAKHTHPHVKCMEFRNPPTEDQE